MFQKSFFVMGDLNFGKQLDKRFRYDLAKRIITQEPFINLVNTIISSKEKIAKYKKHFESLNAIDKIEIKEEIDRLVYGLNGDEIKIIEKANGQ